MYLLVAACTLAITSCEKSEVETELTTVEQEGFMSTTGNIDSVTKEDGSEMIQPLFKMHFGPEVSKEKAEAIFDQKAADFLNTYKSQHKGVSTEWVYKIETYTGN